MEPLENAILTLGPAAQRQLMSECRLAFAIYRWRRFILRLQDRAQWHVHGLLLWLVSRSYLRFLPYPYPSITSVEAWKDQAKNMVSQLTLSAHAFNMAAQTGRFTAQNLSELCRFRDRVGWRHAFLEDSLLTGFLVARGMKGHARKIRDAALEEARQEVAQGANVKERDEFVRQMLGLRWIALPESRLGQAGTVAQLGSVSLRHGSRAEGQDSTYGGNLEGSEAYEPRALPAAFQSKSQGSPIGEPRVHELCMVNCDRTWTSTSHAASGRSAGSKSSAGHDGPGPESGEHDGPGDDAHRRSLQVRASTGHGRSVERHDSGSADGSMKLDGKKIKPGQRQMITQAWEKHRKDQIAVSADRFEINEVWHAEWDAEMKRSMNETFVTTLQFPSPFVTEVYTDTELVAKAARQLGLHAGDSLTLKSGWGFRREDHRRAALRLVKKLKPYCTVLAFPCGPWSPLMQLNPAADLERLRSEGEILINFAIEIAEEQMKHGKHFV